MSHTLRKRIYRKIDRTSAVFKSKRPTKTKILDADIDEFISNLSPDTSDMSDDSDFEFDGTILDKWVAQSKSTDGPDIESMEFIFDVIIKKMPPAVQLPFLGMKRAVIYCNNLYAANLKFFRGILSASSMLVAWVIHFLYILSTSYRHILLSSYRFIIKVDAWMDQILDDRVVPEQSSMMSKTIRDKIAESMKLSKMPVSTKRARELMLHSSGSKTRNGTGSFLKWLHAVDGAKQANEGTAVSKFATDMARGITDMNIGGMNLADLTNKFPDMNLADLTNKFPDMHLADLGADLGTKIQDMHIAENLQNVGGQLVGQLKEIDVEENIKKTKRTMKKMGDGLKSIGNTFGSMFGKKKEPEIEPPVKQNVQEENLKKSIEKIRRDSMSENPKPLSNINVRVSNAKISNAKLSNAKLSNAKFSNPKISNAKLSNAKMSNAKTSNTKTSNTQATTKKFSKTGSSLKMP